MSEIQKKKKNHDGNSNRTPKNRNNFPILCELLCGAIDSVAYTEWNLTAIGKTSRRVYYRYDGVVIIDFILASKWEQNEIKHDMNFDSFINKLNNALANIVYWERKRNTNITTQTRIWINKITWFSYLNVQNLRINLNWMVFQTEKMNLRTVSLWWSRTYTISKCARARTHKRSIFTILTIDDDKTRLHKSSQYGINIFHWKFAYDCTVHTFEIRYRFG